MNKFSFFLLSLLLLSACSDSSSKLEVVSSDEIIEESSSLQESSSSSSLSSSLESDSSYSFIEESSEEKQSYYLEIVPSSIKVTKSGSLLTNYDFDVEDSLHRTFSFHGEEIKRGEGSNEGFIQCRANKEDGRSVSFIASKDKLYGDVSFIQADKGEYTGTPSFFMGEDLNNLSKIEPKIENVDSTIKYSFGIDGYFRFKNLSKYAIYFSLLSFDF
ncbi:MAG TPA: hypothetical protein DEF61_05805 [Firmicutes bacterium]|nr:hypothetical protein [Bacillota bacterium]